MRFNSFSFLFFFLPATIGAVYVARRCFPRLSGRYLLLAASAVFYAFAGPLAGAVLLSSIGLNYLLGARILALPAGRQKAGWLALGLAANLGVLIWFKMSGATTMPLGLSFFTFTQIAYLVDTYVEAAVERDLWRYTLFVSFFPSVSAGPLLRHTDMAGQLSSPRVGWISASRLARGATLFALGLFKKTVLAENLARVAAPVFNGVAQGAVPGLYEAWLSAFAFSFQIYFDFSGYSDMAVGLGWVFGIKLPWNFDSPYHSLSVVDFWRRWHISLSDWMRNYICLPVNVVLLRAWGGGRIAESLAYATAMVATMVFCGLWHGFAWVFLAWGVGHALLMLASRLLPGRRGAMTAWSLFRARAATFVSVTLLWVLFRSPNLSSATRFWKSMLGAHGLGLPPRAEASLRALVAEGPAGLIRWLDWCDSAPLMSNPRFALAALVCAALVVWGLPNSRQWMLADEAPLGIVPAWRPSLAWAAAMSLVGAAALMHLNSVKEFFYFQF